MRGIGCREYGRPRGDALLGPAVVHIGGRQQPEAAVMMRCCTRGKKTWQ
jgi:hypothetical protein